MRMASCGSYFKIIRQLFYFSILQPYISIERRNKGYHAMIRIKCNTLLLLQAVLFTKPAF